MDSEFHKYHDSIYHKSKKFDLLQIQCFPLAMYFFALNVTRVDLLSIDIQGKEREILLEFPFDEIFVRYIAVEHYVIKDGKRSIGKKDLNFIQEITSRGFVFITMTFEEDYFFKNIKT